MGENDLLRQSQVPCLADLQTAALPLVPGKHHGLTALVRTEGSSLQDDRDENSHVLTDFFLEELLRTNVTGSNMFHLPESFQVHSLSDCSSISVVNLPLTQVSFFNQVMRSEKPILVLMKEYYNLSQSAQQSFHAAKKKLAKTKKTGSTGGGGGAGAGTSDGTPLWLPMPQCMCDENPALKKKSDNKEGSIKTYFDKQFIEVY